MRWTALANIARRPAPRVSGFLALTQLTCVSIYFVETYASTAADAYFCWYTCSLAFRLFLSAQYTDLFRCTDYMHHANPKTPIEETMRALKELQA